MDPNDDITNLIKEKYLQVKELLKKKYSEKEPYKSFYEAKEVLCEMKKLLKQNATNDIKLQVTEKSRLSGVYYLLGIIYMSTEELTSSEKYLLKCFNMIEETSCLPDNILCGTACLNQLGLLFARTSKNEEALNVLKKAINIYTTYTESPPYEDPLCFFTMYTGEPPKEDKHGKIVLEKTHTLTLYYMAQVYTAMEDREKGAFYCFETLKRQIEYNDYENMEWAINAATMSQVLIEKNAFKEARHHLAASMFILDEYEKSINQDDSLESEKLQACQEEICRRKSDVLRCWIKYCIMLLNFSKERLMADDPKTLEHPPEKLQGLQFPSLLASINEKVVTCKPLLTFDDARPVFLFGQQCCNEASNYYNLSEHASDYASISMDHNHLYAGLSFFEEDEDRQCKMLKRRYDILSNVIQQLNPDYYIDICRDIWKTLGQICSDMVELKVKKIRILGEASTHSTIKVNTLIEDGVRYYRSFVNSFIDRRTNKMPVDYPPEHEQSIILTTLYSARLFSSYIKADKSKSMEIDKKSLECYQAIVDYAKSHKDMAERMAAEVRIAKDMVILLPYKLSRINQISIN